MKITDFPRDEHRVRLLLLHRVGTPKRRKPVRVGEVAKDRRKLIEAKCEEKGWTIKELVIQPDPLQIFLQVWPQDSVSHGVKELKGITAFELRKKYEGVCILDRFLQQTLNLFRRDSVNVTSQVKFFLEGMRICTYGNIFGYGNLLLIGAS